MQKREADLAADTAESARPDPCVDAILADCPEDLVHEAARMHVCKTCFAPRGSAEPLGPLDYPEVPEASPVDPTCPEPDPVGPEMGTQVDEPSDAEREAARARRGFFADTQEEPETVSQPKKVLDGRSKKGGQG